MTIVAVIQMASGPDIHANMLKACSLIEKAAHKGAQLVVLPEEFATLGIPVLEKCALAARVEKEVLPPLAHIAKKHKLWLVGGTLPTPAGHHKIYSSCFVWDPAGHCVARYDKMHLFDVTVGKGEQYRESDNVSPGKQVVVLETPIGKIGLAICYDIRFPELFRSFMLKGVQLVVLPSAFTINTGKAHWEILLKARAIENMYYMLAPNQYGNRYGHSMIIGPWGETLAFQETGDGVLIAEIELEKMRLLRQQFPALSHCKENYL